MGSGGGGPNARTAGVMTATMEEEIAKAAKMVREMTEERALNPDAAVPQVILKNCAGLAFLRVAKLGFGLVRWEVGVSGMMPTLITRARKFEH